MTNNNLEELRITALPFLNKSTIIYGQSGSGKSTIIYDILHKISKFVGHVLVFNPSEQSNHAYGSVVPPMLIHSNLSEKILKSNWDRQEAISNIYKQRCTRQKLHELFCKICEPQELEIIKQLNAKKSESGTTEEQKWKINMTIRSAYKLRIDKHREKLIKGGLTDAQQATLNSLFLNPMQVVIFDDCTEGLKKLKNSESLSNMFTRGRHANITILLGAHAYTSLPPIVRDNAMLSIFGSRAMVETMIANLRMSRLEKSKCEAATNAAFCKKSTGNKNHQKLVRVREEDAYYRLTATPVKESFRVGDDLLWTIQKKIEPNADEDDLVAAFLS